MLFNQPDTSVDTFMSRDILSCSSSCSLCPVGSRSGSDAAQAHAGPGQQDEEEDIQHQQQQPHSHPRESPPLLSVSSYSSLASLRSAESCCSSCYLDLEQPVFGNGPPRACHVVSGTKTTPGLSSRHGRDIATTATTTTNTTARETPCIVARQHLPCGAIVDNNNNNNRRPGSSSSTSSRPVRVEPPAFRDAYFEAYTLRQLGFQTSRPRRQQQQRAFPAIIGPTPRRENEDCTQNDLLLAVPTFLRAESKCKGRAGVGDGEEEEEEEEVACANMRRTTPTHTTHTTVRDRFRSLRARVKGAFRRASCLHDVCS